MRPIHSFVLQIPIEFPPNPEQCRERRLGKFLGQSSVMFHSLDNHETEKRKTFWLKQH